jgi:hypothetical protein
LGEEERGLSSSPNLDSATLAVPGGDDLPVIEVNQEALEHLTCTKAFDIVPAASHLFSEPGALEAVADLAAGWFDRHLLAEILATRQPPTGRRRDCAEQRRPLPGW